MKHARNARIIYPYGSLGDYNAESMNLELGGGDHHMRLSIAMDRIKTFAEGAYDRKLLAEAARKADRIVFLGYGFHKQNNDMFLSAEPAAKSIYATCHGASERAQSEIGSGMQRVLNTSLDNLHLFRGTCSQLLDEHRAALID